MKHFADNDAQDQAQRAEYPNAQQERFELGQRSQFYSAATLKDKPVKQREWLVHGLIPQKTVTLLGGDGGTGKSLLTLQLAVAVAIGGGWIGKGVSGGPVSQSAVRSDGVVVTTPSLDQDLGLAQRVEELTVQQFVPKAGVETLAVAVHPSIA
jgi:predicted ATP-dependent serine protease